MSKYWSKDEEIRQTGDGECLELRGFKTDLVVLGKV